jgi:hypothetical protein
MPGGVAVRLVALDLFGPAPGCTGGLGLDSKGLAWMLESGATVVEAHDRSGKHPHKNGSLLRFYKPKEGSAAVLIWKGEAVVTNAEVKRARSAHIWQRGRR